jgi:hypothetical protein
MRMVADLGQRLRDVLVPDVLMLNDEAAFLYDPNADLLRWGIL